jgi:hypothetical protein
MIKKTILITLTINFTLRLVVFVWKLTVKF